MDGELIVRRGSATDFPRVLELARRSLGWTDDDASFLTWKHLENPFGESPMWVATSGDRVVGFRTFMRWEFVTADGRVVRAARAVDTATDPDFQGRGIFTRLTLDAVASLPDDGVELIFNTPNGKSLPGYLKMGWHEVGRLPVAVMPTSWRFPAVVVTARAPAGRLPLPTTAGEAPADVFGREELEGLLDGQPPSAGFATRRSRAFFSWRYGNEALGYRVTLADPYRAEAGFGVFRRRRRGRAVEAVLGDVVVPGGHPPTVRRLIRQIARLAQADYVIRLDRRTVTTEPFVRLPRIGPVLACRPLDGSAAPPVAAWDLSLGDVELF